MPKWCAAQTVTVEPSMNLEVCFTTRPGTIVTHDVAAPTVMLLLTKMAMPPAEELPPSVETIQSL